jgi:hypothetical protein
MIRESGGDGAMHYSLLLYLNRDDFATRWDSNSPFMGAFVPYLRALKTPTS